MDKNTKLVFGCFSILVLALAGFSYLNTPKYGPALSEPNPQLGKNVIGLLTVTNNLINFAVKETLEMNIETGSNAIDTMLDTLNHTT